MFWVGLGVWPTLQMVCLAAFELPRKHCLPHPPPDLRGGGSGSLLVCVLATVDTAKLTPDWSIEKSSDQGVGIP